MSPTSMGTKFFCPTRVKTLETFPAADPWNNGRASTFTIEAYIPAARGSTPRADAKPPFGVYFLGLRSAIDGTERMLPESLAELWRQKRVTGEALPRLLRQLEPELKKQDYSIILANHTLRKSSRFLRVFGIVATLFFGVAGLSSDELRYWLVLAAVILAACWFHPNRLYYGPKARRMRQMETVLSRG